MLKYSKDVGSKIRYLILNLILKVPNSVPRPATLAVCVREGLYVRETLDKTVLGRPRV